MAKIFGSLERGKSGALPLLLTSRFGHIGLWKALVEDGTVRRRSGAAKSSIGSNGAFALTSIGPAYRAMT